MQNQNPYPPAPPPGVDPLAGAAGVGLDLRSVPPALGESEVTIESIRYHQGFKGPGILIDVLTAAGEARGWRIQLGGQFPHYGIRDAKILLAACEGWGRQDPRAIRADDAALRAMMTDPCPYKGRKIAISVVEDTKVNRQTGRVNVDPTTGRPYVRVYPRALGTAAEPGEGNATAPAPVQAPVQAPVTGATAEWFAFPPSDPRHGTHVYNRAGEIRPV